MTIERKVGMGIAGQPSGGATDVAEVFSTDLYTGNGGTKTITSGIDISGEGGLVITKARDLAEGMNWVDTVRGAPNYMRSHVNDVSSALTTGLTAFNSTGHVYGSNSEVNQNTKKYVAWTFRKKEKFFDVVTYSGNEATSRMIAHSLGSTPAVIIVKSTTASGDWYVYHTSLGRLKVIVLNSTGVAYSDSGPWYNQAPTSTHFGVGSDGATNGNGQTYVAYLFADNSSEDADDQMIKCGSYTGNGSATGPVVNLGWEPQFVLIRNASDGGNWLIMDSMRGIPTGDESSVLAPNSSAAESSLANLWGINLTATGFQINVTQSQINASSQTYIYMAIRAPMMIEPTAATDVFATVVGRSSTADGRGNFLSGFPVDFGIAAVATSGGTRFVASRLTSEEYLQTSSNAAGANSDSMLFDFSDGWGSPDFGTYNSWMWKRAKGYMDVVAYTGNGTAGRTVPHSLSVIPEMIWVKRRSGTNDWPVYNKTTTSTKYMFLSQATGSATAASIWNDTAPTSSVFTVGNYVGVNGSSDTYIAYLFATLDGISKVGSYTGNGTNQTISCGFSAGSRFILIKRTDATGSWYVWDSVRGIVAGNDPYLILNGTASQVTSDDSVDPANAGFIVNQVSASNINVSSATYIFYAIA